MKKEEILMMQVYTDMYTTVSLYEYGVGYRLRVIRSGKLIDYDYFWCEKDAREQFKQVVMYHFNMHVLHTQEILNQISKEIHLVQHNVLSANNLEDAYNSVCNPEFANTLRNLKEELSNQFETILNWGVNGKIV